MFYKEHFDIMVQVIGYYRLMVILSYLILNATGGVSFDCFLFVVDVNLYND